MKKVKVEVNAIIFSEEEINRLKELLKYCQHRIIEHPKSGIRKMKWAGSFIEYLVSNL